MNDQTFVCLVPRFPLSRKPDVRIAVASLLMRRVGSFVVFALLALPLRVLHPASLHAQALPNPLAVADGDSEVLFNAEDLSDTSLLGKPLSAAAPLAGGTTTTPEFTRELLQMQWRSGDPIDVYVIRPTGATRPPVTIYLYGYPVDANRFVNDEFCRLVTRGGGAAIGFVPALTGQRYHGVAIKTYFLSELHDSIVRTVHDVQMMVDYAQSRPDLDAAHVAIFGQGAGATIAGLAAIADRRIGAVDLLDPWGDWPRWMASSSLVPQIDRARFLTPGYLDALVPLDPVRWLPSLAGRALKFDDALYETGTPAEAKRRMEAVLPSSALLVRYATKAEFQGEAIADGKLLAWIQRQQTAPSAASPGADDRSSNQSSSLTAAPALSADGRKGASAGSPGRN